MEAEKRKKEELTLEIENIKKEYDEKQKAKKAKKKKDDKDKKTDDDDSKAEKERDEKVGGVLRSKDRPLTVRCRSRQPKQVLPQLLRQKMVQGYSRCKGCHPDQVYRY